MRKQRLWILLGLLAVCGFGPVRAGSTPAEPPKGEIGILGGASLEDSKLNPKGEKGLGPVVGARLGYRLAPQLNWFLDYTWGTFKPRADFTPKRVNTAVGRTGLELLYWPKKHTPWNAFIAASGGVMDVSFVGSPSTYKPPIVSLGLGVRRAVQNRWAWRAEVRADHSVAANNSQVLPIPSANPQGARIGASVLNYQALLGVSLLFGGPPKDSDGDGVPDKYDLCPNTPRHWPVDAHGCPLDSDGDGVPDGADKCPNTPKGAKVDAVGCPLDSDGDGVPDGIDKCPDTPKGAVVDAKGCPIDSDGDGVPDGIDQCPNTPKGVQVDAKGCPLPIAIPPAPSKPAPTPIFAPGKKSLILQGVNFESGKAVLTPASTGVLDKVAASLKDSPDVRVEIGGHTDSAGRPESNQKLSQARAESVRNYLVRAGVDASRLTCKGYGSTKPIADNGTPEGRAQNRRVELSKAD